MVQKASNSKESLPDSAHQEDQGNRTFNKGVDCETAVAKFITVPSTELTTITELFCVCHPTVTLPSQLWVLNVLEM